jgi:hypothetical protein
MFRLFGRKQKPESLPEKFIRLLAFHAETAASTRTLIAELKRGNQPQLLLWNYSHLVYDFSEIAVMRWRQGEDPRGAIADARSAYLEMMACRDEIDPRGQIPVESIAGITDWDFVHSLFWLVGSPEPVRLQRPELLNERYSAYSHYLLCRTTGLAVPPALAAAVERFKTGTEALVDRDFHDKLELLDGAPNVDRREALITRIERNWRKRRNDGYYAKHSPIQAGTDASNDLSVDHQLACILHRIGETRPQSPHAWKWG